MTGIPDNVKWDIASGEPHADPFADEKPLYIITAKNMDQYRDLLAPGVQELFKRFPDTWEVHVYPTHRPAAAPQWIYDKIYQNALTAEILGDHGLKGAIGAQAFPILSGDDSNKGKQQVWNHVTHWKGKMKIETVTSFTVYPNTTIQGDVGVWYWAFPYAWESNSLEAFEASDGMFGKLFIRNLEPASARGDFMVLIAPLDYTRYKKNSWEYTAGSRRVRRTPNWLYDFPGMSGLNTIDDYMNWEGPIDRFTWKSLGKKEMLIPYNNYQLDLIKEEDLGDLLTVGHPNPKYIRWELHRVHINKATLQDNARHPYGSRVFYQDEDTWHHALQDKYDTRGQLWRHQTQTQKLMYDIPCPYIRQSIYFSFQKSHYAMSMMINGIKHALVQGENSDELYTPQYLRRVGRR